MIEKELMQLKMTSAKIRVELLEMLLHRGYGHLGGSMSIIETLSVLYQKQMRHDPANPHWEGRDYLVLSKGHSGPGLYAALAVSGYFDKEMLLTLNEGGTRLPSHPDRLRTPGIDATTGSLGQGTSVAAGLGISMVKDKSNQYVYLIVGDGELNEGQCWEAFQFIAHHKLHKVIVMIDENKKQLDGLTKDIIEPFDIQRKMKAFGFYAIKADGGNEEAISDAIDSVKKIENQAVCIILDTVKGQGSRYFEELQDNHSVKFGETEQEEARKSILNLRKFIAETEAALCGN